MSKKSLSDQYKKTDILKDWMHRDMASSPSAACFSTTSSDNNQKQQLSLSSLESFLFLPQLPVDGDDEDVDAWLFRNNHHQQKQQQQQKRPLASSSSLTILKKKSTESSSKSSPHNNRSQKSNQNGSDKRSCCGSTQSQPVTSIHSHTRKAAIAATRGDEHGSSNSHVCGKSNFPTNSLFPFVAINDTVTASSSNSNNDVDSEASSNKSSVKKHSSMSIFINNNSSNSSSSSLPRNNSSHNHSPFYLAANHHHRHHHPLVHQPPHHHFSRRRLLIFRICQTFSVLICVLLLITLVKNCFLVNNEHKNRFAPSLTASSSSALRLPGIQNRLVQSWNMPSILSPFSSSKFILPKLSTNSTSSNNDSSGVHNMQLLDVPNFRFLMNNKTKCYVARDDDDNNDGPSLVVSIVHSAPQNFLERQAIRRTWASLQNIGQFHFRLMFLLGHQITTPTADEVNSDRSSKKLGLNEGDNYDERNTYSRIQIESEEYGDIVTGDFVDSYRNLTYKHLMGYLWILKHCSHANYVLKADDDVFIDVFALFDFLLRTFGPDPEAALICNVIPEGTKPVRQTDLQGKKWTVSYEEYPYETYPKYCAGNAYVVTPNVISEIYRTSRSLNNDDYFWIDDVFITGILRKLSHVEPFYMNLRYTYDPEEYRNWLVAPGPAARINDEDNDDEEDDNIVTYENKSHDGEGVGGGVVAVLSNQMKNGRRPTAPPQKIPFMIVHLERGSRLGKEMRDLWNKTVSVWSGYGFMI